MEEGGGGQDTDNEQMKKPGRGDTSAGKTRSLPLARKWLDSLFWLSWQIRVLLCDKPEKPTRLPLSFLNTSAAGVVGRGSKQSSMQDKT